MADDDCLANAGALAVALANPELSEARFMMLAEMLADKVGEAHYRAEMQLSSPFLDKKAVAVMYGRTVEQISRLANERKFEVDQRAKAGKYMINMNVERDRAAAVAARSVLK